MLKFSEILEFSRENSYFERIRMVRMVRMVRSLADRTFQLWLGPPSPWLPAVAPCEAGRMVCVRPTVLLMLGLWRPLQSLGVKWIIHNNSEFFSQNSEFSANFWFVFANLIEKATHVTIFWNLARNPEKNSSKIRRKNAKFEVFAIELMNIH